MRPQSQFSIIQMSNVTWPYFAGTDEAQPPANESPVVRRLAALRSQVRSESESRWSDREEAVSVAFSGGIGSCLQTNQHHIASRHVECICIRTNVFQVEVAQHESTFRPFFRTNL